MTIPDWLRSPIRARIAAWLMSSLAALLIGAVAFGAKTVDMVVASTPTIQALQVKADRQDAIESALKNFIAASAEVNPALSEALDRRQARQDSAAELARRLDARYESLGGGK